jgi:hypothetical protein
MKSKLARGNGSPAVREEGPGVSFRERGAAAEWFGVALEVLQPIEGARPVPPYQPDHC